VCLTVSSAIAAKNTSIIHINPENWTIRYGLKVFRTLQAERYKAELWTRRTAYGERQQELCQDICRLIVLAHQWWKLPGPHM